MTIFWKKKKEIKQILNKVKHIIMIVTLKNKDFN